MQCSQAAHILDHVVYAYMVCFFSAAVCRLQHFVISLKYSFLGFLISGLFHNDMVATRITGEYFLPLSYCWPRFQGLIKQF